MPRIEANWDRPLEANHITNIPPDKQSTWPLTQQYMIAGLDVRKPNDGFHANAWYTVTGGTSFADPGTQGFKSAYKATGNDGSDYPQAVLYGVKGTGEEGWIYDPLARKWYKDIIDVAGPGTDTSSNLPPGPDGAPVGGNKTDNIIEFSVGDDGDSFWVAKTPNASAAKRDGNPHPGISIINPDAWDKYAAGMTVTEALSLDTYKELGWTGLSKKILAWNGGSVTPAGEELASAMDAAMKGDKGAQRALRAVGIKPPGGDFDSRQGRGLNFDIGLSL